MADNSSNSFFTRAGSSSSSEGGLKSILASKPRPNDVVGSVQSTTPGSALPHPSPHRTFSGPTVLTSTSHHDVLDDIVSSPISPQSATSRLKSLRFEKTDETLKKSKTSPVLGNGQREDPKRRHSADPRMNVHTKCGRNSDDWLFSGWNVADNVKKIWDGKESKAQSPISDKRR